MVAASETHREIFDWVDEFISITANSYRYRLYHQLESRGANINSNTLKKRIAVSTGHEIKYRKSRNYPSIPDPGGGNSELLYRESTLKKTMASVLYLKLYPRRAGIWLENFFYGLAAAVAMSSALGILFIWKGLSLGEFSLAFFIRVFTGICGSRSFNRVTHRRRLGSDELDDPFSPEPPPMDNSRFSAKPFRHFARK